MNSVTDLTVRICNLDELQEKSVRNCVINHSMQPSGIFERIGVIFYLIVEKGKMYFQCSDWDKAVRALEQKSFQVIPQTLIAT